MKTPLLLLGLLVMVSSALAATPLSPATCPLTIDEGGDYYLTGNWTGGFHDTRAILVTASGVTIDGMGYTLTGTWPNVDPYATAVLVYGNNVTIRNLTASGWHDGLIYGNNRGALIEGVTCTENVQGLTMHNSSCGIVRASDFSGNADSGILLHINSRYNLIEGNTAHQNKICGINLNDGCSYNVVRNNKAYDCDDLGLLTYAQSNYNLITGNELLRATNNSIDIWSDHNEVTENYCAGSHGGIYLDGANNNLIARNQMVNNRDGGFITAKYSGLPSTGNVVENNLIQGAIVNQWSSQNIGVILYTSGDNNIIRSNRVLGNNGGILIHDATGNQIYDNVVTGNQYWPVKLEGTTTGTVWNTTKTERVNVLGGRWTGGNYWPGACASGVDGFCPKRMVPGTKTYDNLPLATNQPPPLTPTPTPLTPTPTPSPSPVPTSVPTETVTLLCSCTRLNETYLCTCTEAGG